MRKTKRNTVIELTSTNAPSDVLYSCAMDQQTMHQVAEAAGLELRSDVTIAGNDPILPSRFPIGEAAAVVFAALGSRAADLAEKAGGSPGPVATSALDGVLTTIGFAVQRLNGEPAPRSNQSNPFVHCYEGGDGRWIYLHGGFPNLAAGLASILGVSNDASFADMKLAVAAWGAQSLEDTIAERNFCGAMVRSHAEWLAHPQGIALEAEPTVAMDPNEHELTWAPDPVRPLAGLRVLDMTRVLAGPTCGKYLASLGAEVTNLRSDHIPQVPSFLLETGVGKQIVRADLRKQDELEHIQRLAMDSHVVVQGYRPWIVNRFGLDAASLRIRGWRGIYGNISCYGGVGPWSDRAGWEQLAQSVSGMAVAEGTAERPAQVPAALNDYTTGLLLAEAITRQLVAGTGADIVASLCQTAGWLMRNGAGCDPKLASGIGTPSLLQRKTEQGVHHHLSPGFTVGGLDIGWPGSSA